MDPFNNPGGNPNGNYNANFGRDQYQQLPCQQQNNFDHPLNGQQPNGLQLGDYQPGGHQPGGHQPQHVGYQPDVYQPGGHQPSGHQLGGHQPHHIGYQLGDTRTQHVGLQPGDHQLGSSITGGPPPQPPSGPPPQQHQYPSGPPQPKLQPSGPLQYLPSGLPQYLYNGPPQFLPNGQPQYLPSGQPHCLPSGPPQQPSDLQYYQPSPQQHYETQPKNQGISHNGGGNLQPQMLNSASTAVSRHPFQQLPQPQQTMVNHGTYQQPSQQQYFTQFQPHSNQVKYLTQGNMSQNLPHHGNHQIAFDNDNIVAQVQNLNDQGVIDQLKTVIAQKDAHRSRKMAQIYSNNGSNQGQLAFQQNLGASQVQNDPASLQYFETSQNIVQVHNQQDHNTQIITHHQFSIASSVNAIDSRAGNQIVSGNAGGMIGQVHPIVPPQQANAPSQGAMMPPLGGNGSYAGGSQPSAGGNGMITQVLDPNYHLQQFVNGPQMQQHLQDPIQVNMTTVQKDIPERKHPQLWGCQ